MLVFASKEHCNEDLVNRTLDGDDSDDTEHRVRSIP